MNRIATALLTVTAVSLVGFGIALIFYRVSRPFGPQFGAGEMFGTAVGIAIIGWGAGVGWSAQAVRRDQRGGWILAALSATAIPNPGSRISRPIASEPNLRRSTRP